MCLARWFAHLRHSSNPHMIACADVRKSVRALHRYETLCAVGPRCYTGCCRVFPGTALPHTQKPLLLHAGAPKAAVVGLKLWLCKRLSKRNPCCPAAAAAERSSDACADATLLTEVTSHAGKLLLLLCCVVCQLACDRCCCCRCCWCCCCF